VTGTDASDRSPMTEEDPDYRDKPSKAKARWNMAAVKAVSAGAIKGKPDLERASHSSEDSHDMAFDGPEKMRAPSPKKKKKRVPEPKPEPEPEVDPLEDLPTDRTPMKKLIKRMKDDDPSLTVLKLDGRKKIKPDDWEAFFESIEENTTLTHLSVSRCDLTDELAVGLVLALVENETLLSLKVMMSKRITDDTAKGFVKVFEQSNKSLKKLDLTKTKVTKKSLNRLNEILEERDEKKIREKLQEERQAKIQSMLKATASEEATEPSEDESDTEMDMMSGRSSLKSGKSGKSKKKGRRAKKNETSPQRSSRAGAKKGRAKSGRQQLAKSVTAAQMAQLGGDIVNVGADAQKLKDKRRLKGECETCGQKCFNKTMFKTTPISIPHLVHEGKCLKCNPM